MTTLFRLKDSPVSNIVSMTAAVEGQVGRPNDETTLAEMIQWNKVFTFIYLSNRSLFNQSLTTGQILSPNLPQGSCAHGQALTSGLLQPYFP